jgi:hypothetical protein
MNVGKWSKNFWQFAQPLRGQSFKIFIIHSRAENRKLIFPCRVSPISSKAISYEWPWVSKLFPVTSFSGSIMNIEALLPYLFVTGTHLLNWVDGTVRLDWIWNENPASRNTRMIWNLAIKVWHREGYTLGKCVLHRTEVCLRSKSLYIFSQNSGQLTSSSGTFFNLQKTMEIVEMLLVFEIRRFNFYPLRSNKNSLPPRSKSGGQMWTGSRLNFRCPSFRFGFWQIMNEVDFAVQSSRENENDTL